MAVEQEAIRQLRQEIAELRRFVRQEHGRTHEISQGDEYRPAIENSGTLLARQRTLNFSTGLTASVDPDNKRIVIVAGGGAPTDAEYVVEAAHGSLSAEVLIGTVIETAVYGSLSVAAKNGRLKFPSDSFYILRDTGSILAPWGPIFPMTEPVDGDFAWVNQGGASVVTTNGGIHLNAPASGSNSLRIRTKSAPSTPYTITMAFIPKIYQESAHMCGLVFRQSSDGKCVIFGLNFNTTDKWRFLGEKWNSPTSFNSAYTTPENPLLTNTWFFRIADDGSNRIMSFSYDGQNFMTMHTVGRTDFLTADQVGFFADSANASHDCGITILSWVEG